MTSPSRIDDRRMARRVASEFRSGEVVVVGSGLPTLIPGQLPPVSGVLFLSEGGALGYTTQEDVTQEVQPPTREVGQAADSNGQGVVLSPGGTVISVVDVAAMIRGGHVDTAVVQPAQVSAGGDFSHWTTAATPGLFSPAGAVDMAYGAGRVIAMMSHNGHEGRPNIVRRCSAPLDGVSCVSLIITDVAVLRVEEGNLVLAEVAPGWRADDVAAITGAPLAVSTGLREMTFDRPILQLPGKVYPSGKEAIHDLPHGATVLIDGFAGPGGTPHYLLVSLRDHGARDLTMVSNTAGLARAVGFGTPPGRQAIDHSILIDNHQVKKAIASYPVSPSPAQPTSFELALQRGEVELEVVPQGTLAERIRAGGAGVAAFYTPTGVGTLLAEGKETRVIDGKEYVLEQGLQADFCLIRAHKADTMGNVVYKGTSRNFNAIMAPAACTTVIEVDEIVEAGTLGPEEIVTPGVFIDRIVQRPADFSPYE